MAVSATPASTTSGPDTDVTLTADLPVRRCPTTIAIAATPATTPMPALVPVTIPAGTAGELAVYADSQDTMALVGPKGWDCTAMYGADGSWVETCTLPAGQKAECTASLNAFLARYGKL